METRQLSRILGLVMLTATLFVCPSYADEIMFKAENHAKIGTVLKIDAESVTIRFPRESIQSVIMHREGVSSSEKADEIIFEDQGVQTGRVLEIHEKTVTISFPRESIQSIVTSRKGIPSPEEKEHLMAVPVTAPQPQGGIKGNQEGIERHEPNVREEKKLGGSGTPVSSSKISSTQEQLLKEEMGLLQGIIIWRGVPLENARVKIVLEKYTGFSLAALKRMFTADKENSQGQEITLVTQTDSQGHYSLSKVPPGYYRIYWMPENESSWYHRLREKPDFEISSGQLTIQNIPGKKK